MKPGKIIKWIFIVLLAMFFIFLLVRIFMQGRHEVLTEITATDSAINAYYEDEDAAFSTISLTSEISDDGYFSAYSVVYCESFGEFQLTTRYNDSLYEKYFAVPDDTEFSWELRDGDGNILSTGKAAETKKSYIYTYTRLIFSDVMIEPDSEIYLYLICNECNYPTENTKGFPIHLKNQPLTSYKLSKSEKEALSPIDK